MIVAPCWVVSIARYFNLGAWGRKRMSYGLKKSLGKNEELPMAEVSFLIAAQEENFLGGELVS